MGRKAAFLVFSLSCMLNSLCEISQWNSNEQLVRSSPFHLLLTPPVCAVFGMCSVNRRLWIKTQAEPLTMQMLRKQTKIKSWDDFKQIKEIKNVKYHHSVWVFLHTQIPSVFTKASFTHAPQKTFQRIGSICTFTTVKTSAGGRWNDLQKTKTLSNTHQWIRWFFLLSFSI